MSYVPDFNSIEEFRGNNWLTYTKDELFTLNCFYNYTYTVIITLAKRILDNKDKYTDEEYNLLNELLCSKDVSNVIIANSIINKKDES